MEIQQLQQLPTTNRITITNTKYNYSSHPSFYGLKNVFQKRTEIYCNSVSYWLYNPCHVSIVGLSFSWYPHLSSLTWVYSPHSSGIPVVKKDTYSPQRLFDRKVPPKIALPPSSSPASAENFALESSTQAATYSWSFIAGGASKINTSAQRGWYTPNFMEPLAVWLHWIRPKRNPLKPPLWSNPAVANPIQGGSSIFGWSLAQLGDHSLVGSTKIPMTKGYHWTRVPYFLGEIIQTYSWNLSSYWKYNHPTCDPTIQPFNLPSSVLCGWWLWWWPL